MSLSFSRIVETSALRNNQLKLKQELELPSLRDFLISAWENVLHPFEPLELEGAWYIDLICEWLTVLTIGTAIRQNNFSLADRLLLPYDLRSDTLPKELLEVRKLLINISPRCSKSTIVTTCWPCWEWLAMPWLSYMCLSYDQSLASDHSDDRRKIIQSDWYQRVSSGMVLSSSKNRITEYQNQSQGQMVARGLNAGVTGGGGLRIICLPYNQVITTASGVIEIGSIVENRIDVEIATFNHDTGKIEYQPILAYEKGEARPLIKVTILRSLAEPIGDPSELGRANRSIICTEDHPIFVEGRGYVRADEIQIGDPVKAIQKAVVTNIERLPFSDKPVYNVKTENHNYFAGGVLVHNCDDGNDPNKVESEPIRQRAGRSFNDYSVTRRNNPKLAVVVNVQQRTHDCDISGGIIADGENWTHAIIPMEAEQYERVEFPLSGQIIERQPGDLMHPERFDAETIASLKKQPWIWASRYQQRPQVSGGGMFKIRNWRLYADLPATDRTILSVDAAFKKTDTSDFVTIGVIAQRLANTYSILDLEGEPLYEHEYYLPYRWKNRAGITETEAAIISTAQRHPQAIVKLIEDKANGSAIIERLERVMPGIIGYSPGGNSKESRAAAIQPIQYRGDILLPIAEWAKEGLRATGANSMTIGQWWDLYPPPHESTAEHVPVDDWVKDLIDEAALFPNGTNDDQVDMLSQGINWLESQPNAAAWAGFSSEVINVERSFLSGSQYGVVGVLPPQSEN